MGVFLLRAYCEAKDLYKNIQLPVNNTGKPRIVVFDAPGALRTFLRPQRRGLLYDFHQQQMRVRSMVRTFKQAGYELVVFLDNAIPDAKLTTWYRRRAVEAATLAKLNKHLAGEAPAGKPDKDKSLPEGLWLPPNTALQVLGDEFAQLGCKVFFSFDDSDREAAYWAKENKAFAVITDDTDFMCYEGVDRIWSANIKLPNGRSPTQPQPIRISELRRQSLLDSLGLSQTQLQQLAGLLGNDHIKHIAKDKVAALKAAHPNQHCVAVLAQQVLQLQPQLASLSPAAAAAAAATADAVAAAKEAAAARERERALIDPVVLQVVASAVESVCRQAAEAAAAAAAAKGKKGKAAASGAATEAVAPEVTQLVATAVSRTVAAADGAAAGSDDEVHDELEDGHHEDDVGQDEDATAAAPAADADDDAAVADAAGSAPADEAADASPSDMLVDRCRRSLLQYAPCDVKPPVQVGSGDRWLLQHKGILMRGVGLEDMSKTPSHVLLQPLRLSVYASMGLSSVTEYLCVPDEKWKEWAAGRAVRVPAQPAAGGKKSGKPRRGKDRAAAIDPAVKKLVAAIFATVLAANGGAPADAADAAAEPAAAAAAADEPAAAAVADANAAEETPTEEPAAAGAADAADPAADGDDGIHPAVKKLVAAAVANVVAGKASGRGSSKAFDPLPKALPSKPLELVQFIVRQLRALDPSAEQFSRQHEKLLLLQASHRNACQHALRMQRLRPQLVSLPDLHAANLFLQGYSTLQIAADGKLPKITSLLHVEAFHMLAQNQDQAAKVAKSPSDADMARDAARQQGGPAGARQAGMAGRGAAGLKQGGGRDLAGSRGGQLQQRGGYRPGPPGARPGRDGQQGMQQDAGRCGYGRRGDHQQPYGAAGAAGYGMGGRSRGYPQHREGYQPYQAGGAAAAGVGGMHRGPRQQQQQGEPLTWQQQQQGGGGSASGSGTARYSQQQQQQQQQQGYSGGYSQQAGYGQQYSQGYQQYDQSAYYQQYGQGGYAGAYGGSFGAGYGGQSGTAASRQGAYGSQASGYEGGYGSSGGYGYSGAYGTAGAYGASGSFGGGYGTIGYGSQPYSQQQYGHQSGRGGSRQQQQQQQQGNGELTWQQQQMVGGGSGAAAGRGRQQARGGLQGGHP